MGLAAALIAGVLRLDLAEKALVAPVNISLAVLVAGLAFRALGGYMRRAIWGALVFMPMGVFLFVLVVALGLLSSVITAIIAALVLVEVISVLRLPRKLEVGLNVVACFAIGLGAALTPVGEPLATIAISKLDQGFWYLAILIGPYIIPGILALGAFAALYLPRLAPGFRAAGDAGKAGSAGEAGDVGREAADAGERGFVAPRDAETYWGVVVRALKVYLFVMALVMLGEGFKPVIDRFVIGLPSPILYWLNMVSAILDNATLTAAEISLKMNSLQVRSVLMGLLISGGMLIPGNIPNIISAGKLRIGSREWAALGVPLGLVVMVVYFIILFV